MNLLTRFWIEFDFGGSYELYPSYVGLKRGCGVTAYNFDDAKTLLETQLFKDDPFPNIKNVCENIDVSTLDAGHILPNIGMPANRGIWYPSI